MGGPADPGSIEAQVLLAEIRHEDGREAHAAVGLQVVLEQGREHARTARPEPLMVCTNSRLPVSFERKRICARRA